MHWRTILRNVLSNWASYAITAIVGFTLAPVVLHHLGDTGYGLWTLVLSLTGYFGLLDLGIRSSVGRFVARHLALQEHEDVNRTVNTALAILSAAGLLAMGAALTMAVFFDIFHVEPNLAATARMALVVTGLNMALILPLGVFSSVLIALERYDVLSGVTVVSEIARAALVLFCVSKGYGLAGLALAALAITLVQYSAIIVFVRRLYRPLKLRFPFANRVTSRNLLSFGLYRFIWIVAYQLIVYSNSVIIGAFLGAGAITYFAIAAALINYGRNVVSLVTDTFVPAATRMDAVGDMNSLRRMLLLGTKLVLLLAIPLCLGLAFLGRQFITLWMGADYAVSSLYLAGLTISLFCTASQYVAIMILSSMARHKLLAWVAMAEGVVNVVLSIVLIREMGLMGVVWGAVIPNLVSMLIFVPAYTLRVLGLRVREYVGSVYAGPAMCAIPTAAVAYALGTRVQHVSWLIFTAEAALICAVFGGLSLFICFDGRQRAALLGRFWSLFQREPAIHEI